MLAGGAANGQVPELPTTPGIAVSRDAHTGEIWIIGVYIKDLVWVPQRLRSIVRILLSEGERRCLIRLPQVWCRSVICEADWGHSCAIDDDFFNIGTIQKQKVKDGYPYHCWNLQEADWLSHTMSSTVLRLDV